MVYIVQQNEPNARNVIGLFQSLSDALICVSIEEALNDCRCAIYEMDVKESSNDDQYSESSISDNIQS